jgi:hypothetical protein
VHEHAVQVIFPADQARGVIDAENAENGRLRTEATFDERIYASDTAPFTF